MSSITAAGTRSEKLDLASLRARLASERGRRFWRSLDEIAETDDFVKLLENEFREGATEWVETLGRRRFLQLMGASLALAGLQGCTRQPAEKIVPAARTPEYAIPGKPRYFATTLRCAGNVQGVLVESHEGRPTKIEGNPQHPASLGATDAFAQASILTLYDPDRSQVVMRAGEISRWTSFLGDLKLHLEAQRLKAGAGLRLLTGAVVSPTMAGQIEQLIAELPGARWLRYEPAGDWSAHRGAALACGEDAHVYYDFAKADVVLSLDADFLTQGAGSVRYARDFTAKRRAENHKGPANRLYVAEAMPSSTGSMAEHRLRAKASEIQAVAAHVAARVGANAAQPGDLPAVAARWVEAAVADLEAHRGRSAVIAGDSQPPAVHALALAINARLGNIGGPVIVIEPAEQVPESPVQALGELAVEMESGAVDLLIMLGVNPVYDAPADLEFASRLEKVPARVHLGLYVDETARLCQWHIPEAHALEAWSDVRAHDGTASIVQPLIEPLYDGKSAHELVAAVLGHAGVSGYDLVRAQWQAWHQGHAAGSEQAGDDFERFWRRSLHDGLIAGTAGKPKTVSISAGLADALDAPAAASSGIEVAFRPDPTVWDGSYSNNGWMQELPKPLTKITWDNAALISPATAERLELANEDVVELSLNGRSIEAPVWIAPGHANDAVTVTLGYGRTQAGRVGDGAGFNAYALRTSDHLFHAAGVEIRATGRRHPLASTQEHHSMEGRHLVRSASLEAFEADPKIFEHMGHRPGPEMTLYPGHKYEGYSWGMAIDLNSCTGCNACMVACTAENNTPVVGKEQVAAGREMHWIRIDRYYEGSLDDPEMHHQPVMCQHCEDAPCEPVCPVGATVHSSEGLNEMVYNRCVGTRYCSNNCPYKVRRFNFLHYSDYDTESLKMLRNPDVTVRTRGVMEKCTYCVQRINAARIDSEKEGRGIRDGEIVTACQSVCPAQAIVFGNINDPESRVSRLKQDARNYGLLEEVNTRPRTSYLAKVTNYNPELGGGSSHGEGGPDHG